MNWLTRPSGHDLGHKLNITRKKSAAYSGFLAYGVRFIYQRRGFVYNIEFIHNTIHPEHEVCYLREVCCGTLGLSTINEAIERHKI